MCISACKTASPPIDGDTLKSGDTEVRLYGIDASELYQTCTDATGKEWACGRSAQTRLKALIGRKVVDCAPRARDKFNRIVAVCRTSSVPDLGEALVCDGHAVNFGASGDTGPYTGAETEAQAAKRELGRRRIRARAASRAEAALVAQKCFRLAPQRMEWALHLPQLRKTLDGPLLHSGR